MPFYSSISRLYRHIFPFNEMHLKYTRSFIATGKGVRILDVGCGVGDLSRAFAAEGWKVDAIDYDQEMVEMAKAYTESASEQLSFFQMDMRHVADHFPSTAYDLVSSYGNTLVHLLSDEDIRVFFNAAYTLLKPGGKLLLQILNYDKILDEQVSGLPLLDNDHIRFERSYAFRPDGMLDFQTLLTDKGTGEEIRNSIVLNPLRSAKLQDLLQQSGFENVTLFDNFRKDTFSGKGIPLVLEASKL